MSQSDFDNLPNEAFLRQSQLINQNIVPFSASTLWRRIKERRFPAPVSLGGQITAWRVSQIRQWLQCPESFTAETNDQTESRPAKGTRGAE